MDPPASHGIPRVPRYSGACQLIFLFVYMTITFFGSASQTDSTKENTMHLQVRNPGKITLSGLASIRFARHYYGYLG